MKTSMAQVDRDVMQLRPDDKDVVKAFSEYLTEMNQYQFSWELHAGRSAKRPSLLSECGIADKMQGLRLSNDAMSI